jgi:hypothetical protein
MPLRVIRQPSEIDAALPIVCPGDAGCGEDGDTTLSVR